MNIKTISKKFLEASCEYYESATVLVKTGMQTAPYSFLYRHALELALKAIIVEFHGKPNLDDLSFVLDNDIKKNAKLDKTHSISVLVSAYLKLNSLLIPATDSEKVTLLSLAEKVDAIDYSSDFFRYPYKKGTLAKNNRQMFRLGSDIASEIKPHSSQHIIVGDGFTKTISVDKNLLEGTSAILELLRFVYQRERE